MMHLGGFAGLLASTIALHATIEVGPGKPHGTIEAAVAAAQAGDTIAVTAGDYVNDFVIIGAAKDGLTIKGVGGRPHLRATVAIPNKKGIIEIQSGARDITLEDLEVSGAFVSAADGDNGAAVRMQGNNLVVRRCYFHDNQNGILGGGDPASAADPVSQVLIEHSHFAGNGNAGSGYEHNIYIGAEAAELTLRYSYSHHAKSGHNVKSRALRNYILYNRIMDESTGTASAAIDIPQGGPTFIVGNLIQQGPSSENQARVVWYKLEDATNPTPELYVVNNTIVNDATSSSTSFIAAKLLDKALIANNVFVGRGRVLYYDAYPAAGEISVVNNVGDASVFMDAVFRTASGDPGDVSAPPAGVAYEASDNLSSAHVALVDRAAYDYRLAADSDAVDAGREPGSAHGFWLRPSAEYVHPSDPTRESPGFVTRTASGQLDAGAYELAQDAPADGGGGDDGGDDDGSGDVDVGLDGDDDAALLDGSAVEFVGGYQCAAGAPGMEALLFAAALLAARRRARDVMTKSQ